MALVLGAAASLTGCSDNAEQGLYPASDSDISISAIPSSPEVAGDFHNGLLTVGSAQSATSFSVTSTTRWIVEVANCEGAWCHITYGNNRNDAAGQIGDGSFIIDAAPNRSTQERTCDVIVRAVDAVGNPLPGISQEIHIEQDSQSIITDYAGDEILPTGTTPQTEPVVKVTANQPWTASTSHSWVTIVPGAGMSGDSFTPAAGSAELQTVSFRISVQGNPGTSERSAIVTISSPSSAFTPIRLNVTQRGSTSTFVVLPTEVPVVSYTGDEVKFQVYSSKDSWQVKLVNGDGWITLDTTQGTASPDPVTVTATIRPNGNSNSREASLVFSHEGMDETVRISQEGNPDAPDPDYAPVVSEPWLASGWTASYVRVMAYFRSPLYKVIGGGVTLYSHYGEQSFEGDVSGNELLVADIWNLDNATTYEAVAYVMYEIGGTIMRAVSAPISFTTPDRNGEPDYTPVVSEPWLESGWTASHVQIYAYYQSPVYRITGCGAYITSATEGREVRGTVDGNGRISVEITGLQRATEYTVTAFVEYGDGGSTMRSTGAPVSFTTPGQSGGPGDEPQVPNPGDNTPPSPNGN